MGTTKSRLCPVTADVVSMADPAAFFSPAFGVPHSMTFVVGLLDSPASGRRWFTMRSFFSDKTRGFRPMAGPVDGDYELGADPKLAYGGPVVSGQRDGESGYWRPDGVPLLAIGPDTARWVEAGVAEIEAERVGDAWRWHSAHPDHPQVFTSCPYRARGRLGDDDVEGALWIDTVHMPLGKHFYPSPYIDELEIAIGSYLNELEDGSWESGCLLWGRDGYEVLVAQRQGETLVATGEVTATGYFDDHEPSHPTRVRVAGDGDAVTWEAEAQGRWPLLPHLPAGHRLRRGTARRDGCAQAVRHSWAYLEAFRDRAP